jgi:hypothetical protein
VNEEDGVEIWENILWQGPPVYPVHPGLHNPLSLSLSLSVGSERESFRIEGEEGEEAYEEAREEKLDS